MEKKIQKQEVERPVTVRMKEFRTDLQKIVMKSELPAFLLEMLLSEFLGGISQVAKQEYEHDQKAWDQIKNSETRESEDHGE